MQCKERVKQLNDYWLNVYLKTKKPKQNPDDLFEWLIILVNMGVFCFLTCFPGALLCQKPQLRNHDLHRRKNTTAHQRRFPCTPARLFLIAPLGHLDELYPFFYDLRDSESILSHSMSHGRSGIKALVQPARTKTKFSSELQPPFPSNQEEQWAYPTRYHTSP